MKETEMICKWCREAIEYRSIRGWIHTDSKSVWCGLDAKRQAEPKGPR